MAKQEEVLQKVNDYCTEKQYTLNDDFRSKFSEKFADANADADIADENVLNSIKFNIDTAFSAASKELKIKDEAWKKKESEYKAQIESLKVTHKGKETIEVTLPEEVKTQLDELNRFREKQLEQEKRAKILELAKKEVRSDLHNDLEEVLNIMNLDYKKDEKDLAKELNSNFTKLYKKQIGDTKPITSHATKDNDEEFFKTVKKIKV